MATLNGSLLSPSLPSGVDALLLPSPSSTLFEKSMGALVSTFKYSVGGGALDRRLSFSTFSSTHPSDYAMGQQATVHGNVNTLTHAVNVIPTQEYIAGSFLDAIDSCKLEQAAPLLQEVTPIEYGANMLMIDGEKPIIGVTNDMSMNPFAEPPKQETTFDSIPFRARAYTDPSRPTPVRQREFMSHRPSDPPPFTGQLFDDVMAGYYAQRRSINAANAALNFPPMEFEHRNNNNNFGGVRPTGLSIHVDPLTQLQNIGQIQRIYAPSKRHVPQANTFRCNFHRCNSGPFSTYESLQSHIALHMSKPSRGKTYKCEKCPQMFSRSHDLKRHYYVHSDDKPYKCKRCTKGFSRRDALQRHERAFFEGKKVHCLSENDSPTGNDSPDSE